MSDGDIHRFRLYVAGEAQNSLEALANLAAICRASIPDRYSIEVVDVFEESGRTLNDGMTPTLIKLWPQRRNRSARSSER